MVDPARPALYLIKQDEEPKKKSPPAPRARKGKGSSVTIEVERGQLLQHSVDALSPEDALALLSGLAMALVQVVRASKGL